MKNSLYIVIVVALGIVLGGLDLYEANIVYQDHETLSSVVNFLNSEIAASQKQQTQAPVVTK